VKGMFDQSADETGISFATWQDRQLAVILARIGELSRELREANAAAAENHAGRNEELSRELGRATALLEIREAELQKLAQREASLHADVQHGIAKAAALGKTTARSGGGCGIGAPHDDHAITWSPKPNRCRARRPQGRSSQRHYPLPIFMPR